MGDLKERSGRAVFHEVAGWDFISSPDTWSTHLSWIATEDNLGAARVGEGNQQLRLHGLRALVYEHVRESGLSQGRTRK